MGVTDICFNSSGAAAAIATAVKGNLYLIDTQVWQCTGILNGYDTYVYAICFSTLNPSVLAACSDGKGEYGQVNIWNIDDGSFVKEFVVNKSLRRDMCWNPVRPHLAFRQYHALTVRDVEIHEVVYLKDGVTQMCFSPPVNILL
jgi:hypothetical protein